MGFFSNKKEDESKARSNLPELPGMTRDSDLPALPSFPKTAAGDSMNLNAIKSSVGESSMSQSRLPEMNENKPKEIRRIEATDWDKKNQIPSSMLTSQRVVNKEPVFIKIDKFKDVVKKFDDIKIKVEAIESSLHKITEIKAKEDAELNSWESEVQLIKEKIKAIDDSLFNKI